MANRVTLPIEGSKKSCVRLILDKMLPHEILPLDIANKETQAKNSDQSMDGGWPLKTAKKRQDHDAVKSIEKKINEITKRCHHRPSDNVAALLRRLCKFCIEKQLCDGPKFRFDIDPVDTTRQLNI